MDHSAERKKNPNPVLKANILSVATLYYIIPTFIKGYRKGIDMNDLYDTLPEHQSNFLGNKIERGWERELILASKYGREASLQRVLFRLYGAKVILCYGLIIAFSEIGIKVVQALALGQLIGYYIPNQHTISKEESYLYSFFVVFCSLANVFINNICNKGLYDLGMMMKIGCCSLLYRKALKLNKSTLGQTTVGQMVNLLSNDVNRFDFVALFGNYVWICPVQTVIITYLMYLQVGISAIIGVALLIIFVPVQFYLGRKLALYRQETAVRTDERIRLMNEIITGIEVIKMYTWEKPFATLVAWSRRFEINSIRKTSYVMGILSSCSMFMTRLSLYASVLAYAIMANTVSAKEVFVLTAFYNVLRQSITIFFAYGIGRVAEANISLRRLTQFMLLEENPTAALTYEPLIITPETKLKKPLEDETALVLKNVFVRWARSKDDTLSNINLKIAHGDLVGVVGPVGSGKSSLLYTILKELPLISGSLQINGKISYASQEAWIFPGTVRQNILFGLPLNQFRYKNVIQKCALRRDLSLLPNSDKTIVGERGITLSGGQRARINLARAIYREADIYLLDDPLSAVDTKVGKQLFEDCICNYLKNKTVILITHQLQYLNNIDNIIIMQDGVIKAEGNLAKLQKSGLDFAKLLKDTDKEKLNDDEEHLNRLLAQHRKSLGSTSIDGSSIETLEENEEELSTSYLSFSLYKTYFTTGSHIFIVSLVMLLFTISQVTASASDYFLSYWVNTNQEIFDATHAQNSSFMTHLDVIKATKKESIYEILFNMSLHKAVIIYTALIATTIVASLLRSFAYYAACMRSSINLHDNMFERVTRATMKFFTINPSGRILNRFSKDMGSIDELLPFNMMDFLQISLTLVGVVVIIGIVNAWLIIPTVVFCGSLYLLRKVYLFTSRSVKRMEGVTRSPVFAYLSSSIQGLSTIRAFNAQPILEAEFDNHQDLHTSAWFLYLLTSRALSLYLDITSVAYVAVVTLSFIFFTNEKFGGNVGLAITQAVGLTGMLQWGIKQSTEMENQMTSVERVLEYSEIEKESSLESLPENKPPKSWPNRGKIKFVDVYLTYFPSDPPVLKNLNFNIQPLAKIGIVGRTGAGKSSLIAALFRLVEIEGSIVIDGIDIKALGLHDLRSKISIIPQEPVLFSGSLRRNLDPFDEYSDDVLWNALEEVELKDEVIELTSGLSSMVSEGGSNFSVGQRQLICLARALIRNNKILILDEATANVDPQTDALIQKTIRKKFDNCTVLTIAHRLHTVMDSNKVLVMDGGRMLEFDHPYLLLQNKNGYLYGMVQQTGEAMAAILTKVSQESYHSLHPVEDYIKL